MAKITAWAELHTRYGATGGVFFDKYMGVQPMPPMTVPVHLGEYGQKYEEAGVQDGTSLAVVDPEKTLVNIARDAARHNAITGVDIKISEEKVLAGKQLFRREDKAA
ncbi:hypothetical protein EN935_01625 [Mesorhizobium sp. M7D.F.Ca.US.004.03.1.1]|nr:hypothetical protein [Mesorhizobium sp. M7D.F.Ca.US.004.03.1.1]RVA36624.1 hypothetical protein EN935_01625 [Mesorhizobium sp. M7D.F.Ca.US.004.03.1.1]